MHPRGETAAARTGARTRGARLSASPRPVYEGPSPIPFEKVARHTWGDEDSGQVEDWIYFSSDKVHQIIFTLQPGGSFRHSDRHRTIFAADEVFYVLEGTLALSNPETGEVHRAEVGEAIFFRRDTWHHGFNFGTGPARVLEFFAPPPSKGTSQKYAQTKPLLKEARYARDGFLGSWPSDRVDAERKRTMKVIRPADLLWRLEGGHQEALAGILVSTEHLTVGTMRLLPGKGTGSRTHRGDLGAFVLEGRIRVIADGREFDAGPRDGLYIPEGTPYECVAVSDEPADFIFGIAPDYRPSS